MDIMIYKKKWPAYVFIAPAVLFMVVFLYYPFVINIFNSFFNIESMGAPIDKFIGLKSTLNWFRIRLFGLRLKTHS